jgi:hypothetical protein
MHLAFCGNHDDATADTIFGDPAGRSAAKAITLAQQAAAASLPLPEHPE